MEPRRDDTPVTMAHLSPHTFTFGRLELSFVTCWLSYCGCKCHSSSTDLRSESECFYSCGRVLLTDMVRHGSDSRLHCHGCEVGSQVLVSSNQLVTRGPAPGNGRGSSPRVTPSAAVDYLVVLLVVSLHLRQPHRPCFMSHPFSIHCGSSLLIKTCLIWIA